LALGENSHAEGDSNTAEGWSSHAEGYNTQAIGDSSHAEGDSTEAIGNYSHAEGQGSVSSGAASHAEGLGTIALGNYQHTQGRYNITSSQQSAFIIGNGIDDENRSNLVFASGSEFQITGSTNITGSLTVYGIRTLINSTGLSAATFRNSTISTQYIEVTSQTTYESQLRLNSTTSNYGWSMTQNSGNFYIGSQPDVGTSTKILTINRTNGNILVQGNNTTANYANASAAFQINSTTQGFLPPRMTEAQRVAISTPATGLMVYQTDGTEGVYVYTSTGWRSLTMV
jgi:hypothetical protein